MNRREEEWLVLLEKYNSKFFIFSSSITCLISTIFWSFFLLSWSLLLIWNLFVNWYFSFTFFWISLLWIIFLYLSYVSKEVYFQNQKIIWWILSKFYFIVEFIRTIFMLFIIILYWISLVVLFSSDIKTIKKNNSIFHFFWWSELNIIKDINTKMNNKTKKENWLEFKLYLESIKQVKELFK